MELRRERDSEDDPNAILVLSQRRVPIGHIGRADAAVLAPAIHQGRGYEPNLHCLRGGLPDYPNYGARISIAWDDWRGLAPLPPDEAQTAERRCRKPRPNRQPSWSKRLAQRLTELDQAVPGV